MPSDQQYRLVDKLFELTLDRRLKWKTTADTDVIVAAFENFVVHLIRQGRINGTDYEYSLRDKSDREIDRFSDNELGENYYKLSEELFELARRQASGADKAIEEILKELEDLDDDIQF